MSCLFRFHRPSPHSALALLIITFLPAARPECTPATTNGQLIPPALSSTRHGSLRRHRLGLHPPATKGVSVQQVGPVPAPPVSPSPPPSGVPVGIVVLIACLAGAVAAIVVLVAVLCFCLRRRLIRRVLAEELLSIPGLSVSHENASFNHPPHLEMSPLHSPAASRCSASPLIEEIGVSNTSFGRSVTNGSFGYPHSRLFELTNVVIGMGGSGCVYKGYDVLTGELVAMKPIIDEKDPDGHAAGGEVELLRHLRHTNIVRYFGIHREPERAEYFVVMEYMPGGSVASAITSAGSLSVGFVWRILNDVLAGLAYLHGQGIVHRDIKPANFLLDVSGACKLSDFGTARERGPLLGSAEEMEASTLHVCGTVLYLSPESLQGVIAWTADMWAVGISVIEMLTGQAPWSHLDISAAGALLFQIGTGAQHPIPDWIPEELRDLIAQCLKHEAKARPNAESARAHSFLVRQGFADDCRKLHAPPKLPSPQPTMSLPCTEEPGSPGLLAILPPA